MKRIAIIGSVCLVGLLAIAQSDDPPKPQPTVRPAAAPTVVKGRLLYSNSKAADRIPVVLRAADHPDRNYRASTGENGRFTFPAVPPGKYRLFEIRVYTNLKLGKCELMARREVSVEAKGLDLGDVTLVAKTIPPKTR